MTGTEAEALADFGKTDILHDNGMWLPHNHRIAKLAARRGIARVVSTRGMLEPWAMRHKRVKKQAAWWLYQRRDLERACCHHATAQAEAENVQSLGLGVPVVMIPNGVDVPEIRCLSEGVNRKWRRALFLGRIYPVKGLPMLVEAWARLRPAGWVLQIAGPDEGGHRTQVEKAVRKAGLSEVVSFTGPVGGDAKRSIFLDADLFVLPTHSENFGMAIAEALAHGLPVLTTTGAPWSTLAQHGCGWWVDASVDGIMEGLKQATSLGSQVLQAMGMRGRELVRTQFGWEQVANGFITMYSQLNYVKAF
jgi:glycosyltransferase involved in cell wall biosynthesis